MNSLHTRRNFLADVGRGMLVATVGFEVAADLELSSALGAEAAGGAPALTFGALEPLVALMQETPVARLLPVLSEKLRAGTALKELLAAGALANARTFGGEDYVGFHTLMALGPAYHMAMELPRDQQPLPVFKVLYRNTNRIQEHGGRKDEVLHPVEPGEASSGGGGSTGGEQLRAAVRSGNVAEAERTFARLARATPEEAFNQLLYAVQDGTEVHRVVLPYRAWDMLGLIGREHAHTLLRQSVRYCVKAENWAGDARRSGARTLLPRLLSLQTGGLHKRKRRTLFLTRWT